jgi:Ca-activated chloride channel family protein
MPEQFHFIQPWWLLALLPLALLLWRVSQQGSASNPWRKIVDARLLPLLMHDQGASKRRLPLWLLAIGWLLAVLALADPTWEQQPRPLMQTSAARVIVLDLSRSMLAADLQPSRLVRARFKVEDILAHDDEGQTGLVVFAGDAFGVTPLTRDADTIRAQLKALEPNIMPSQGSRADLGLLKAQALLQQAGVASAQVILIADGVEGDQATQAAARLRQSGYRVSVLGAGTAAGAPLPDGRGGVTQDASGKTLLMKLDQTALQDVAQAGGGRYSQLTGNETDIRYLLDSARGSATSQQARDAQTQQWKEQGPLLAVLLLPLAALAFRRGWLLSAVLCTALLAQPQQAVALGWNDLWLRNDQQAAQALQQGEYEQAARLARDPAQRGSAAYKKGDYQQALDAFNKAPGSDAAYNRGNTLAKLGEYQQAIAAYDEALEMQPGMEDAAANKAAVEAFLKQQEQQQDQKDPSGQQGEQDQQADSDATSSGKDEAEEQQQGAQQDSNESSDGENGEPSENEQVSSDEPPADGSDDKNQEDNTDNAFARANKQMDEDKPDSQNDEPSDPSTPADQEDVGQARTEEDDQPFDPAETAAEAEELSSEEQLAAQQWLRRIADDPGGLLRRKFLYQYRQRGQQAESGNRQDW